MPLIPTNLEVTLAFDSNQGLEPWPGFNVLKLLANAHNAFLLPPMPLVCFSMALFCHEVGLNVFK